MTLADDIARIANQAECLGYDQCTPLIQRIAAGLERENIIIPKADLPEAAYVDGVDGQWVEAGINKACASEAGARANALEWLAISLKQGQRKADQAAARESAEARLQERRAEVLGELEDPESPRPIMQHAIDRIIEQQDRITKLESGRA